MEDTDNEQVHSDLAEIPEEIGNQWKVKMMEETWIFVKPDPAEVFQMVNRAKKGQDIDMEKLFNFFWDKHVLPCDRPAPQKPQLFDLKGDDAKNEAFSFIVGVFKKHFLGGAPL